MALEFEWDPAKAQCGILAETQGKAWVEQVQKLFPQMARIVIEPDWVGILDFETRFPSVIAAAMSGA